MALTLDCTEAELQEVTNYIQTMLGGESIDVDVQKKEIYTALKHGLSEFEYEFAIWQIRNQFANIYGTPAGQDFTYRFISNNMNLPQQISDWFASMARVGGKMPWHKDYIVLEPGRQIYDLSLESSIPYKRNSRRIHKIMWTGQFNNYFNDVTSVAGTTFGGAGAWNWTNSGLAYGNNALKAVGQIYDVMLLMQAQQIRNKVLFSEFYYNISGDMLELFPMPGSNSNGGNGGFVPQTGQRLYYYYFDDSGLVNYDPTKVTGTGISGDISSVADPMAVDTSLISNPMQVNIGLLPWSSLSSFAKNWITNYGLAKAKYIQGSKWRKIKTTLKTSENDYQIDFDYQSLIDESKTEIEDLKTKLRDDLEKMDLVTLYENKQKMVENTNNINKNSPRLPFWG